MDNNALKLDLMQRLLETQDEQLLQKVKELLSPEAGYEIPELHKQILKERRTAYNNGNETGSSWEDAKKRITGKWTTL